MCYTTPPTRRCSKHGHRPQAEQLLPKQGKCYLLSEAYTPQLLEEEEPDPQADPEEEAAVTPAAPHPLGPWLHWIRQQADPVKFRPLNSNACNFHNLLVRDQILCKRMPCHAVRLESHIATCGI